MVFNLFLFHFRTQVPLPIELIFIGNSILALAKIPSWRTALVKNKYRMQIARYAALAFSERCCFYRFYNRLHSEFGLQYRKFFAFPGTTQKTIVTDFYKSPGQDVQRKTPDKFSMR